MSCRERSSFKFKMVFHVNVDPAAVCCGVGTTPRTLRRSHNSPERSHLLFFLRPRMDVSRDHQFPLHYGALELTVCAETKDEQCDRTAHPLEAFTNQSFRPSPGTALRQVYQPSKRQQWSKESARACVPQHICAKPSVLHSRKVGTYITRYLKQELEQETSSRWVEQKRVAI